MHGEKHRLIAVFRWPTGSSPRARGKVTIGAHRRKPDRIIPACTGKRRLIECIAKFPEDHPRVHGEKQQITQEQICCIRIIPACTGKRLKNPRKIDVAPPQNPKFYSVSNRPHKAACNQLMLCEFALYLCLKIQPPF